MSNGLFNIMLIIIPIVAVCIFVIAFSVFISPKFRVKILKRNIDSAKYLLDESKDSIKDIANMGFNLRNDIIKNNKENFKDFANLGINIKEDILKENEDALKDISRKEAEIDKEKIKIYASSIKEGLSDNQIYCKHCGSLIDNDSKFCKQCGKEQ